MLWTIAFVLFVLWLLGVLASTTMGGFIHVLLAVAVIVLVIGFSERNVELLHLRYGSVGVRLLRVSANHMRHGMALYACKV